MWLRMRALTALPEPIRTHALAAGLELSTFAKKRATHGAVAPVLASTVGEEDSDARHSLLNSPRLLALAAI